MKLMIYGRELERVGSIKFLGVILDARLTFAEHIKTMEDKSKKVINVMRCLTEREWGYIPDRLFDRKRVGIYPRSHSATKTIRAPCYRKFYFDFPSPLLVYSPLA